MTQTEKQTMDKASGFQRKMIALFEHDYSVGGYASQSAAYSLASSWASHLAQGHTMEECLIDAEEMIRDLNLWFEKLKQEIR